MKFQTPSFDYSRQAWDKFLQENRRHLEELQGVLPDRVLELARLPGAHDGLISEVFYDYAGRSLRLTLVCGDLVMGYYDLTLTYQDCDITAEHEARLVRLAHSADARDAEELLRHEVDVAGDGGIEHRLEFSDGRETTWFAIRCRALEWSKVGRPDREFPPVRIISLPLVSMRTK